VALDLAGVGGEPGGRVGRIGLNSWASLAARGCRARWGARCSRRRRRRVAGPVELAHVRTRLRSRHLECQLLVAAFESERQKSVKSSSPPSPRQPPRVSLTPVLKPASQRTTPCARRRRAATRGCPPVSSPAGRRARRLHPPLRAARPDAEREVANVKRDCWRRPAIVQISPSCVRLTDGGPILARQADWFSPTSIAARREPGGERDEPQVANMPFPNRLYDTLVRRGRGVL